MKHDSCNVTPRFVAAGEAIFTLSNGRGDHMTFKVYRAEPTAQFPYANYFVKVLTGADNVSDSDYTYLGRVMMPGDRELADGNDPHVKRTGRSSFTDDSRPMKAIRFALRVIWQIERGTYQLPPGYTILHVGRCGKCSRPLTTPESLTSGFGPDCAAALGIEWGERDQTADADPPRFASFDFATKEA